MSQDALELDGKRFISSTRAAALVGYTKDYVGQLARAGKLEARLVGRSWYVAEDSIRSHKLSVHYTLTKPKKTRADEKIVDEITLKNKVISDVRSDESVQDSRSPHEAGSLRVGQGHHAGDYARRELSRSSIRFESGERLQYDAGSYVPKLLSKQSLKESNTFLRAEAHETPRQSNSEPSLVHVHLVQDSPVRLRMNNEVLKVSAHPARSARSPIHVQNRGILQTDGVRFVRDGTSSSPSDRQRTGVSVVQKNSESRRERTPVHKPKRHAPHTASLGPSKRVPVSVALILFGGLLFWYFLSM